MSNEKKKQTFKDIGKDLANIDKSILDLFEKYESRLQVLESMIARTALRIILQQINQISDDYERNVAIACFTQLLDTLGIKHLEAP